MTSSNAFFHNKIVFGALIIEITEVSNIIFFNLENANPQRQINWFYDTNMGGDKLAKLLKS